MNSEQLPKKKKYHYNPNRPKKGKKKGKKKKGKRNKVKQLLNNQPQVLGKFIGRNKAEIYLLGNVEEPKPEPVPVATTTFTDDGRTLVQIPVQNITQVVEEPKSQPYPSNWTRVPPVSTKGTFLGTRVSEKKNKKNKFKLTLKSKPVDPIPAVETKPSTPLPEIGDPLEAKTTVTTNLKPIQPKIKLNMLPQNNFLPGAKIKYRAGIPRSFYAANFNNFNTNEAPLQEASASTSAPPPVQQQTFDSQAARRSQSKPKDTQRYSPSDAYLGSGAQEQKERSESPDFTEGIKRQSAFERLGPRDEPKKPKLTINLMCIRDQSVREVVDETQKEDRFLPVHLRKDLIESTDEIVTKYLPLWPWKKNMAYTAYKHCKTVSHESELAEEYSKTNSFFEICIKGYPAKWRKEDVLDALLENVKGKSLIPCFIEFTPKECKMLVIRCAPALIQLHKLGYFLRKNTVELLVGVGSLTLNINHIDFIPRLILRKLLAQGYDDERKLTLKAFTLKPDISHFIYFPLNREQNQIELFQMLNVVAWDYLTDLDLSHNRLRFLDGFDLPNATPKLKHLDLSHNCLEKITPLLPLRVLTLNHIKLEGNPLCYNYTDPAHYVKVLRMLFPSLKYIDDLPILLKGELPPSKQNYCPENAAGLVNKFLETFFPLLESSLEEKTRIVDMYDRRAVMTITMSHELHASSMYRIFRNLFAGVRYNDLTGSIKGDSEIASVIGKWPSVLHDPHTFNVDVMHHSDTSTVLRIGGVLKITAHTLADDEYYLSFTRSMVLTSKNGVHYKIQNELLFWENPSQELLQTAFRVNTVRTRSLNIKIDSLDQETKDNLLAIFMTLTDLDKKSSERCLELKEWNLKSALEHFMKLVKLDDIQSLSV